MTVLEIIGLFAIAIFIVVVFGKIYGVVDDYRLLKWKVDNMQELQNDIQNDRKYFDERLSNLEALQSENHSYINERLDNLEAWRNDVIREREVAETHMRGIDD